MCVVKTLDFRTRSMALGSATPRVLKTRRAPARRMRRGTSLHVNDRRRLAHGVERDQPADAQGGDFLHDAILAIAAIEVMREQPIGGFILRNIGVQQIKRDAPDGLPPDLGGNLALSPSGRSMTMADIFRWAALRNPKPKDGSHWSSRRD